MRRRARSFRDDATFAAARSEAMSMSRPATIKNFPASVTAFS
jgi:hypothetical protein